MYYPCKFCQRKRKQSALYTRYSYTCMGHTTYCTALGTQEIQVSDRDYRLTLPSLRVRTALSDVQRAHGPGPPHTLRADLKKRAAKAGRLLAARGGGHSWPHPEEVARPSLCSPPRPPTGDRGWNQPATGLRTDTMSAGKDRDQAEDQERSPGRMQRGYEGMRS